MLGMDTYHGGYLDMGSGHLHPLNLALGLAARAASRACASSSTRR
jgi:gamma-glutamylputrescine oxidase